VPAFYTSLFESKIKGAKQLAVLRDAIDAGDLSNDLQNRQHH
jgi:hypothetical protein